MFKRIITLILAFLLVMQTAAFADPWSYSFYEKLYDDGIDEANGKVYYIAGANNIGYKVKFAMDMGLIKSYAPGSAVLKEDLANAIEFIFGGNAFFSKYYDEEELAETLTVDEAIIVFMDAAGYGPYIKSLTSGDERAYRAEAQRRGLLTSINYNEASKTFTAEMFYNMFYDALHIETISASYSSNGVEYYKTDRSLMDSELDLVMFEGLVTGNSYTTLVGDPGAGEDSLFIDNNKYSTKNLEGLDDFLGYRVHAYLDENNNLCSIAVDERINVTKTFDDSVEIKTDEWSRNVDVFPYWDENDRVRRLSINENADVIYNHIAIPDYKAIGLSLFDISNGCLKFVDNNNDKKYDVVFIEEWVSFLPRYVDKNGSMIEDRSGIKYELKNLIDNQLYKGMFDHEGKRIENLDGFNVNTAVSVLMQYNTRIVTELKKLKEETYEGVLTRNSAEKAFPIKIGDYEFKLGTAYFGEKSANFDHRMGTRIMVYVDQFGKIIKSVNVQGAAKYGWVMGIKKDDALFDSNVKIHMFTENDKFETYTFAKKVRYNIAEVLTPSKMMNGGAMELYNSDTKQTEAQLVKYSLNNKGEVSEIETADTSSYALGATKNSNRFQLNYEGSLVLLGDKTDMMNFGGKYQYDKATVKCFNIPLGNLTDYDTYRVYADPYFASGYLHDVKFYDVNEVYRPTVIVRNNTEDSVSKYVDAKPTSRFLIDKGTTYYPAEDEVRTYIQYALNDWTQTSYISPKNKKSDRAGDAPQSGENRPFGARYDQIQSVDDFRRGDVFDFAFNYKDQIKTFLVNLALDHNVPYEDQVFEANLHGGKKGPEGHQYGDYIDQKSLRGAEVSLFGKVLARDERYIVVNCRKDLDPAYNRTMLAQSNHVVTIYNVDEDTVEYRTGLDIQVGDYIYIEMTDGDIRSHIVYRNSQN